MRRTLSNIFRLGIKELRSLFSDAVLLGFIVWAFSIGIYAAATGMSQDLHNAALAIVDLDRSPFSEKLPAAFYPPYFKHPRQITLAEMDPLMDRGAVSFVLVIPSGFQRDLLAGRTPEMQLAIDATNISQSFSGSSYIQNILATQLGILRPSAAQQPPARLATRVRFNPNLTGFWFGGVVEVINNITLLSIILVGAAFIREREHGTIEHLMVMPLTPFEIMAGKVWANSLVVLVAAAFALRVVVQAVMGVPVAGSLELFLAGTALYLFSTASIGIFMATLARSMPQFGLLIILVVLPLELLSGGITPRESMPQIVQDIMLGAPTTQFVRLAQGVLYRGAGLDVVWPELLAMTGIGAVFFGIALARFRTSITRTEL
ncbi:MAG: ABC transporter permease [Zoogloea sp.]|nr:ABC transporter permease [Zoogloea sp.]